jgi:pyruvate/2-oxoglutarate dehydrogenase complex dihydrolipoamide dehydrogenase (E3) component
MSWDTYDLLRGGEQRGKDLLAGGEQKGPRAALAGPPPRGGVRQLTHVGEYQGEVVASNILGEPREANYDAVPRVVFTDRQAAVVGAVEARFSSTAALTDVARTTTYTHAYAESIVFLTLLSDGERLTGAYALGPEAWGVAAAGDAGDPRTCPARRSAGHDPAVPPTFSEIVALALHGLDREIAADAAVVGAVAAG